MVLVGIEEAAKLGSHHPSPSRAGEQNDVVVMDRKGANESIVAACEKSFVALVANMTPFRPASSVKVEASGSDARPQAETSNTSLISEPYALTIANSLRKTPQSDEHAGEDDPEHFALPKTEDNGKSPPFSAEQLVV